MGRLQNAHNILQKLLIIKLMGFAKVKTIKWKVRVLHTKKPFNSL